MKTNSKIRLVCVVAILGALAGVLMLIEFPLPIAPPFYKVDLSLVSALLAGFSLGPVAGLLVCLVKVLISILLNGTTTAFVGEFAALLMDSSFTLCAALIYKKEHTKKGAIKALIWATVTLMLIGGLTNYFILVPAYVKFMNIPLEVIVSMGNAIFKSVNSLFTLILFCTVPFNLIKGLIISIVTYLLYKRVSPLLQG